MSEARKRLAQNDSYCRLDKMTLIRYSSACLQAVGKYRVGK
jgi:hypothetical protein